MAVTIKWMAPEAENYTGDTISSIDFGTIIVGESATKSFKIANTGTSIAENVTVKCVGVDEAVAWKKYKLDSGAYNTSIALPNIAQNGISGLITVQTTVPVSATLGNHTTSTEVSYVYS